MSGALDNLPTQLSTPNPDRTSEKLANTGNDNQPDSALPNPQTFPPATAQSGYSESSAVTLAFRSPKECDNEAVDVTSMPVNEKDPVSVADNGSQSRVSNRVRTGDLRNHNPAL